MGRYSYYQNYKGIHIKASNMLSYVFGVRNKYQGKPRKWQNCSCVNSMFYNMSMYTETIEIQDFLYCRSVEYSYAF